MIKQTIKATAVTVSPGTEIPVEFVYHGPVDPLAIHFTFDKDGPNKTEWLVGRDLFLENQIKKGTVGEGDITLRRDRKWTIMTIRPPSGEIVLAFPRKEIRSFLNLTYDLVAREEESDYLGDADEELRLLLEDSA